MARKRSRELQQHFEWCVDHGCVISGEHPQLHHATGGSMRERGIHKGMGQKNSDWLVIPLAERYHTGAEGIHKIGVLEWEQRYGTQVSMLEMLSQLCGRDLFEAANQERKK